MNENTVGFYWQPADEGMADQLEVLRLSGANTVVVPYRLLESTPIDALCELQIKLCVDWTVFAGAEVRRAFPESIPVQASGEAFIQEDWYLPACPNYPGLREYHLATMNEVFTRWGDALAGLWLDFIRYPVRWEGEHPRLREACFCRHCLNLFLQRDQAHYTADETHAIATTILQTRFEEWVDWKCLRILEFVKAVKQQLDGLPHSTQLGMFSLPWRRQDLNGAIRTIAAQDLGQLAQFVDVFSPMVYHKLCYQPVGWIADVVQDVHEWTGKPVLPVIQSIDQPTPLPPHELDAALVTTSQLPATGNLIFTLAPLLVNAEKIQIVRARFMATRI